MIYAGQILPRRQREATGRLIVGGAIASRDWQPQHLDDAHARQMNLSGVILNTPTQLGLYCAFITDWAGSRARAARWRIEMKRPISAGMSMTFEGRVTHTSPGDRNLAWVWFDCRLLSGDKECGVARLLFCIAEGDAADPFELSAATWAPPPLDAC